MRLTSTVRGRKKKRKKKKKKSQCSEAGEARGRDTVGRHLCVGLCLKWND